MLDVSNLIVYKNGEFIPGTQASISVFDRGLLFGDAIFEGIREYNGKVFKLDEHIDRLYESAQVIALKMPVEKPEMKRIIIEVLRRNKLQNAHIRPIITRGPYAVGVAPEKDLKPTVIVFAHPWDPFLGSEGVILKTAVVRRVPSQCVDARVKHVGYMNSVLAKIEAMSLGADEALILDIDGHVAEGSGENFLIIKNGVLISPTTLNILNGVTRRTAMQLARGVGIEVMEKDLTLGDVYTADEAFLCGTGAEIVPVRVVDGRTIGKEVPGPITRQLMADFRKLVQKEGTPVY